MRGERVKTYVDVVMRVDASGEQTPLAIVLPDRRAYQVTKVAERRWSRDGLALVVHIGSHVTSLYRDDHGLRGQRWYVMMRTPTRS